MKFLVRLVDEKTTWFGFNRYKSTSFFAHYDFTRFFTNILSFWRKISVSLRLSVLQICFLFLIGWFNQTVFSKKTLNLQKLIIWCLSRIAIQKESNTHSRLKIKNFYKFEAKTKGQSFKIFEIFSVLI